MALSELMVLLNNSRHMKLIWLFSFVLVSCKASNVNGFEGSGHRQDDHKIEITFVNSDVNYYAVMNAINQHSYTYNLQYYAVNNIYQPLNVVCFTCYKISDQALLQFKNKIGACSGVVNIHDTILN